MNRSPALSSFKSYVNNYFNLFVGFSLFRSLHNPLVQTPFQELGKVCFFLGGGRAGASEGRVISESEH